MPTSINNQYIWLRDRNDKVLKKYFVQNIGGRCEVSFQSESGEEEEWFPLTDREKELSREWNKDIQEVSPYPIEILDALCEEFLKLESSVDNQVYYKGRIEEDRDDGRLDFYKSLKDSANKAEAASKAKINNLRNNFKETKDYQMTTTTTAATTTATPVAITIRTVTEKKEIQSEKKYLSDIYYAPAVTKFSIIGYEVKGVELNAKKYIGIGRLSVHGYRVSDYMKEKSISEITPKVVSDAISSVSSKNIEPEWTRKFTYIGRNSDKIAIESFRMMEKKADSSLSVGRFVHELDKEKGVDLESYKYAYLYRYAGPRVIFKDVVSFDPEEVCKENIFYRTLETLRDKMEGRDLKENHGDLDYIQYLCEDLGYDFSKAKSILDEVKKSHKLWDSMSREEIISVLTQGEYGELLEDEDITIEEIEEVLDKK